MAVNFVQNDDSDYSFDCTSSLETDDVMMTNIHGSTEANGEIYLAKKDRPKNRQEFLRNLPQEQIAEILRPLQHGVIDPNSVLSIHDVDSGVALPISGQQLLDTFCSNDSVKNRETPYESIDEKDQNKSKKSRSKTYLFVALCCLEAVAIICLAVALGVSMSRTEHSNSTTISPTKVPLSAPENKSKILIFGGWNKETENEPSIEVYYPLNSRLDKVLSTQMIFATQFSAIGLLNDLVLIAGGITRSNGTLTPINQLQIYNLTSETFSLGVQFETARGECSGAVLDDKFYVCGGLSSIYTPVVLKSCEYFVPEDNSWFHTSDMVTKKNDFGLVAYEGYLFAIGGSNVHHGLLTQIERYNPSTNVWSLLDSKRFVPSLAVGVSVFNGVIWSCGGLRFFQNSQAPSTQCQVYKNDRWLDVQNLTSTRFPAVLITFNERLYAFSGSKPLKVPDNSAEYYDQTEEKWIQTQSYNISRWGAAFVSV